jgi:hypothetical protein
VALSFKATFKGCGKINKLPWGKRLRSFNMGGSGHEEGNRFYHFNGDARGRSLFGGRRLLLGDRASLQNCVGLLLSLAWEGIYCGWTFSRQCLA